MRTARVGSLRGRLAKVWEERMPLLAAWTASGEPSASATAAASSASSCASPAPASPSSSSSSSSSCSSAVGGAAACDCGAPGRGFLVAAAAERAPPSPSSRACFLRPEPPEGAETVGGTPAQRCASACGEALLCCDRTHHRSHAAEQPSSQPSSAPARGPPRGPPFYRTGKLVLKSKTPQKKTAAPHAIVKCAVPHSPSSALLDECHRRHSSVCTAETPRTRAASICVCA